MYMKGYCFGELKFSIRKGKGSRVRAQHTRTKCVGETPALQ